MIYHRKESSTQDWKIALKQEKSMEVWGKEPRGSDIKKVQAFRRSLPRGKRGIEFDSHTIPDADGHPHIACWSGPRPGVVKRSDEKGEYVAIQVFDFRNHQPPLVGGDS